MNKELFKAYLLDSLWKVLMILKSVKFWTFIGAVATAASLYAGGEITAVQFLSAVVAAGGTFQATKAYEDSHRK